MTKAADQTLRTLNDFITGWVGPTAARVSYEPGGKFIICGILEH